MATASVRSHGPVAHDTPEDWPANVVRCFKSAGVRQIGYVPDAGLTRIIDCASRDPQFAMVTLTTEEEGVGLAAGAWLGGQPTVLLMQSSGVGNIVNALASIARPCQLPLVLFVTMRGEWGETNPWQVVMGQTVEAMLRNLGVVIYNASDAATVPEAAAAALQMAYASNVPTCVLVSQRVVGAKKFKTGNSND